MEINFTNIKWDTEDQEVSLPSSVVMEVQENTNIDMEGADLLSDKYGWCVFSFEHNKAK